MSAFGPIDYLRARDLAYQAGAAQGRKGSLGAALGLWQAPTVQDPYQHEPALIAQQKAAGLQRQEQIADEERSFGRNVVLEQLRQSGRGELQGERLAQQRDVFGEREARLREQQAATLAAQGATAEEKRRTDEEKRRTDEEKRRTAYAKWLHTTPGQAATKAQGREWAMGLPYPLRTAALAALDKEEYAAQIRKQGEAEALYEERLERDLGRMRQRAEEEQARAVAAAQKTAAEASQKRLRAYTGILRDLKRDRDKPLHRGASKYRGWSDDQLEDEALAILERGEQRTAAAGTD